MTTYYPIVLETETSGAVSAYVAGLPVYAAADTRAKAEQAIRATLTAYLDAHPDTTPTSTVRVARVSDGMRIQLVGVGALLGTGRSRAKARASQLNGRLGGRPKTAAAVARPPQKHATNAAVKASTKRMLGKHRKALAKV